MPASRTGRTRRQRRRAAKIAEWLGDGASSDAIAERGSRQSLHYDPDRLADTIDEAVAALRHDGGVYRFGEAYVSVDVRPPAVVRAWCPDDAAGDPRDPAPQPVIRRHDADTIRDRLARTVSVLLLKRGG